MKRSLLSKVAALVSAMMSQGTSCNIAVPQDVLIPHGLRTMLINRGVSFHGRSTGTRKAMRAATKRRRILARLPK